MSLSVFLCRHGQDEDNLNSLLNGHRDMPLTAEGRRQAATVAERIAAIDAEARIDLIFSSPLQRALHTAEAIAAAINDRRRASDSDAPAVAPRVLRELIERDFGVMSGAPLSAIRTLPPETLFEGDKVCYFLSGAGVEGFEELHKRAARALDIVAASAAEHRAQTKTESESATTRVLLVSHGDTMKMLVAVRKQLDWLEGLRSPYIANTAVVEC